MRDMGGISENQLKAESLESCSSISALESARRTMDPHLWTCEEVGDWLDEKGFSIYKSAFLANSVSGSVLVKLDRYALAEIVPSLGHRLLLLDEVQKICGPKVPRHVGEGVVGGVSGLASKLMFGLSHLVNDPIEGVSKEGVNGLVKGLATGFAGAIQYPVEGVTLFSKQLGDGLRYTPDAIFGAVTEAEAKISPGNGRKLGALPINFEAVKPKFLGSSGQFSKKNPSHIGEGLVLGVQSFANEFYDGLTGIVAEPMKAVALSVDQSSQGQAFAKGLAKGFTGAVCKPIAGTFDLATCTMEGLMATPRAIIEATKDGPSIQDTPTFRRIASLRFPSLGLLGDPKLTSENDISNQIDELTSQNGTTAITYG